MCELFGYSGQHDRDLARWLLPFRQRGGGTGDNPDGWGVAAWNQDGARLVKSPEPGHTSAQFATLATTLRARLVLAHVRKARHPPVPGMLNTHPFAHACCQREWVFAHNGLVPEVIEWQARAPVCQPLGDTDSEHAFCHLLTAIAERYDARDHQPWLRHLAALAEEIAELGKFNFLLTDGRVLVAYGHDRLHHLEFADAQGAAALIATEPLTDQAWQPFVPGELRVYEDGALLARLLTEAPAVQS